MELATSPEQHQFCTVYARRWIYGRIHFHAVVAVGAVDGSHTPPVWHILGGYAGTASGDRLSGFHCRYPQPRARGTHTSLESA